MSELLQYKDIHGRITYLNKLGAPNILFGYIREINQDHLIWEDNELPYKVKIRNVVEFRLVKLPNY